MLGCPLDTLCKPLEEVRGRTLEVDKSPLNPYRLQRKAIVNTPAPTQDNALLRKLREKVRLACGVLLREQGRAAEPRRLSSRD